MYLSVDIRKKLGNFQMEVSFETENGVTGLLGASGCGKSLTLRCIAGVERPDDGRIVLDGVTLFDSAARVNLPPQKRQVGLMFQNYALFPNMTVEQNILAGLCREKDRRKKQEAVRAAIRQFSLEGLERRRPDKLSGGQQQRVALARILVAKPKLLMLDEPFSALDHYLKWELELELMERLRDFSGAVLFVSHSRGEVYRLCSRACVMDNGKSQPVVPVKELFGAPGTRAAALLSGCKNVSAARRKSAYEVEAIDWGCSFRCGEEVPEQLTAVGVHAHGFRRSAPDAENALLCEVVRVVRDVFSVILMLRPISAGAQSPEDVHRRMIRVEWSYEETGAVAEGDVLWICTAPENILLLKE